MVLPDHCEECKRDIDHIKAELGEVMPGKDDSPGLVPWSVRVEERLRGVESKLAWASAVLGAVFLATLVHLAQELVPSLFHTKQAIAQEIRKP